ncbi:hypothetical protein [Prevotella nigrescens]|uniref:hypothetical protein n=1 Tax=Prevotella nigrescens TaxID=28133 RepID=UPI001BADE2DE|nr:hypothetical protein [Prevotella nigrescens]QUB52257.1 hypothetical protein J5A59_03920 [Prevotella nigrescens]
MHIPPGLLPCVRKQTLPNNCQNSNGVTAFVASGLRQLSLRGYDDCRFGVTANTASGLRQTPLRNIGKHGCLLPCGTEVLKATNLPCVPWKETQGRFGLQVAVLCS